MEEEFINRQEAMKVGGEDRTEEERNKVLVKAQVRTQHLLQLFLTG